MDEFAYAREHQLALTRAFAPGRDLAVETINGVPADRSPYREAFAGFSSTREPRGLRLRRRYGAGAGSASV